MTVVVAIQDILGAVVIQTNQGIVLSLHLQLTLTLIMGLMVVHMELWKTTMARIA